MSDTAKTFLDNFAAEIHEDNKRFKGGPKTAEGKAASSRNALKHGLRAEKYGILDVENKLVFAHLARR